ncbi:metallophosphoesterase [Kribbella flavida DSM 17836]|uniref:Metallophosphoesterase n=1 Tax=Kribbella flavida (strain DSM 17836 / JCM 10339 / NBRC 14399) TaxID=479435 RepID=D2PLF9_KRIFD|nr:LamG-like jellyroll fold domain-containing protein [Kribbella flavida]ADB30588.1 metallophosphoesterase [Kribbella flavida DSM 17836]
MNDVPPARPARRTLLGAALATPAAAATAAALDASPAAAGTGGAHRFDAHDPRFTIAVLPDTQYLFDEDRSDPAPVRATFKYLVEQRRERNLAFMAHLGDLTEHGTEHEIGLAAETFRAIDGKLNYSVLAGNHDVPGSTDDQRGATPYLRAFGPARYSRMSTFGGASPDGYNSYHRLQAGGRQWLVLALDWRLSDKGLQWAQRVISAHPRLPVILTSHDLAYGQDDGEATLSQYGQRLWDQLIRRNDQIFLTLNGHYWPPGRTVLKNDAGNDVHVHVTNYQDRYYGGAGMARLYAFDLVRNVIDVETVAPWFLEQDAEDRSLLAAENLELSGPVDRFSVEIDFTERFRGFAPPAAPAPRPASAVLPRGTVAYWRFDASGLPVAGTDGAVVSAGVVAKDLSRNGNDLTVQRLHASPPEVLTWSDEHHVGQPAHASLRFDGGKQPDRGAVLRTGANAPINSMKFTSGYTIELFVKLPEPFEGDHAWMGLLSWEGRSGDAGKSSGWSPDEPTCSLNLSPERFLQYVVYPTDRDADPTSWSHAVPVGRWMHVAVVNDSRQTVMYVDGSKIARNPTQPSKGISTLGLPFAIGGTQFARRYGQGFYGFIGDVRIVARALHPRDFLTPFA